MGLFDSIKRQITSDIKSAARSQTTRAVNGAVNSAVNSAVNTATKSGGSNKSVDIVFNTMPTSLADIKALKYADLKDPNGVAALVVVALNVYTQNRDEGIAMLNFLKGPNPLNPSEIQFINNRFMDGKNYVPRSFFNGATPDNDYTPSAPYTIKVMENPYSRDQLNEGYLVLHLQSGGADSVRQVKLRTKPSTGEWFLWEQFLLSDIRQPKSADPWA